MKNATSIRITRICFFSSIFFTILPLMRSSVRVELEVRTRLERVDIEADSTSTMTMPISTSGRVLSIEGIIESYIGAPFAPYSISAEKSLPKPPRK